MTRPALRIGLVPSQDALRVLRRVMASQGAVAFAGASIMTLALAMTAPSAGLPLIALPLALVLTAALAAALMRATRPQPAPIRARAAHRPDSRAPSAFRSRTRI